MQCAAAEARGSALAHASDPAHIPPYGLARISAQSMAHDIAKSNARSRLQYMGLVGNVPGPGGRVPPDACRTHSTKSPWVPKAGMKPPRIFPVSHCGAMQAGQVMVKLG